MVSFYILDMKKILYFTYDIKFCTFKIKNQDLTNLQFEKSIYLKILKIHIVVKSTTSLFHPKYKTII